MAQLKPEHDHGISNIQQKDESVDIFGLLDWAETAWAFGRLEADSLGAEECLTWQIKGQYHWDVAMSFFKRSMAYDLDGNSHGQVLPSQKL